MCGERFLFLPPALPYLLSSAHAAQLMIFKQMNSCLPEQLLPGNWITGEENSCYPNSLLYYLVTLALGNIFSLNVHHAFVNIAKTK